ncbi:thiamine phosphate synthase [Parvularcula dongshanensis]|uniref:Thiamine-phosphate pyrophosphorylase n=1 Tax=Parvularcula dongshanensis TaxID=1173995 RepID=A0A840I1X9_9PROT|nr:thiamine phosphate synthase [Parvularcula dongshanensis]MBB4658070.1 thiamine-phosphate pyrophosphorylase [Parvularcula dongshanensis]
MDDLSARVMRLQRAAWAVRRASGVPCALPFALVMMTDERAHPDLVSLLERLPKAPPILIVFRHYGLGAERRACLLARAYDAARQQGHLLVAAGGGGHGGHNAFAPGLRSVSVHSVREGVVKRSLRPHLGLVSPVFATRSHPDASSLEPARAAAIARTLSYPGFALGGVDAASARRLIGTPFQGIAALGAFRT